jgi:hypothetical protein
MLPQRLGMARILRIRRKRLRAVSAGGECMQERTMDAVDYVKPADVAMAMVETGRRKLALAPRDLLIRVMLSGAILGVATSLAFTGAVQTNTPLVGALIFPVGLISRRRRRACPAE